MKQISTQKHDEYVECYVFMNSIKETLGVKSASEALSLVKRMRDKETPDRVACGRVF